MTNHDQERSSSGAHEAGAARAATEHERTTIPKPADERVVYRADADTVVGAQRSAFDLPATIGGALAALGTLVLLTSLLGAAIGSIGYLTGVDGTDLSVGGLVAGLLALTAACVVGGWVAGRIARHRGALHGLVAVLWLVVVAAALAALAALAGDEFDVIDRVGLPNWFSQDALTGAAIGTGLLALALMLLGGWLGGRLADRHRTDAAVEVVQTRHRVSERSGGIRARGDR